MRSEVVWLKSAKLDLKYSAGAQRVELLVRIIYFVVYLIAAFIANIVGAVCWIIQLLIIILTGKREKSVWGIQAKLLKYIVNFYAYLGLMTEERPPVVPEE